jgi:sugar fermentation stimulation protein A
MKFNSPLTKVVIKKRYKRFLADVSHSQLGDFTVHCPNTGSMKNCWQEGWNVWIQKSNNKKRKYPYTWMLSENERGELIGINSALANKIVIEGIVNNIVDEISNVNTILPEVKYGQENSRIDLLIEHLDQSKTFIEVKSVTLLSNKKKGQFPDAVTTRGQKHIRELMDCVDNGNKAILFFLVQHTGIESVEIAKDIDIEYFNLVKQAIKKGVKVIAYKTQINESEIVLDQAVPFRL